MLNRGIFKTMKNINISRLPDCNRISQTIFPLKPSHETKHALQRKIPIDQINVPVNQIWYVVLNYML
jgi:hypothetical protein